MAAPRPADCRRDNNRLGPRLDGSSQRKQTIGVDSVIIRDDDFGPGP
jgi:hypothetical protein